MNAGQSSRGAATRRQATRLHCKAAAPPTRIGLLGCSWGLSRFDWLDLLIITALRELLGTSKGPGLNLVGVQGARLWLGMQRAASSEYGQSQVPVVKRCVISTEAPDKPVCIHTPWFLLACVVPPQSAPLRSVGASCGRILSECRYWNTLRAVRRLWSRSVGERIAHACQAAACVRGIGSRSANQFRSSIDSGSQFNPNNHVDYCEMSSGPPGFTLEVRPALHAAIVLADLSEASGTP